MSSIDRNHLLSAILKTFQTVFWFGVIAALLFTLWTPANIFSESSIFADGLSQPEVSPLDVLPQRSIAEPEKTIGIIVGHQGFAPLGYPDPGAVCYSADGRVDLREVDINLRVATLLKQELIADGYQIDLLNENDPLLDGYKGLAVISIHSDSCKYFGEEATGFKVQAAPNALYPEFGQRLANCVINRYAAATGLKLRNYSTPDMDEYHAFEKFDPETPSIIIELGYMLMDRKVLTEEADKVALGIAQGIRCFANNELIEPGLPAE